MRAQQLSHRPFYSHPMRHSLAAVLVGLLAAMPPAGAGILTWTGLGNTDWWSNNTNWSGSPPPNNGDTLQFQGTTRLTPNNDLTNRSIAGISFQSGAGAFTLNGNGITSTGNISNLSTNPQTINMPITVGANQTWDGGTAGLTVNGTVTLGANHLTLAHQAAIANNDSNLTVGDTGTAALTVQGGSTVSTVNGTLGLKSGSKGTATVEGADSKWTNSSNLYVGFYGAGTLNVQNGGAVNNTFNGFIGVGGGGTGTATVDGVGSIWTNGGGLTIGNSSTGSLNIKNGGVVSNNFIGTIGAVPNGGPGMATVDGEGSTWTNGSELRVGFFAPGTLNIQNGGSVSGSELRVGLFAPGTLNIQNGGSVSNTSGTIGFITGAGAATVDGAGSTWINTNYLTIGKLGIGTLTVQNGGAVSSAGGILGENYGSIGTVTVEGAGSTWVNDSTLTVGNLGTGTLIIQNGGVVSSAGGFLGQSIGIGTVTVEGADSKWTNSSNLYVGAGTLNVQNGGAVNVDASLNVGSKGMVQLSGGDINATQLQLAAGSTLSGHGKVSANVTGGSATALIQAGGGLSLGNLNTTAGFNYGGKLDVGSNHVTLNDKDQAHLGVATTLADGGILDTVNGAVLGAGETLSYAGDAYIDGAFTNNGLVDATGAGTLTFLNAVDGTGGFGGDIHFHDAYRPGNSPAIIDFRNGDATFDATSLLTMELFGARPGMGYDQLINIDQLNFTGALDLIFGGGFVPVNGQIFNLFDFTAFSGRFDPARIGVTGFDRARLDFSYLPVNGELRVTAAAQVPLPGTLWLFLWGLGTLLFGRRTLGGHRRRANTLYGAIR